MTEAPKRIWATINGARSVLPGTDQYLIGGWEGAPREHGREYILAAEHDRIVAEARRAALEEAAQCCDDEADRCDDAVKWGGSRRYIQNCKAAAYAMRDRAYAIRALAEKP